MSLEPNFRVLALDPGGTTGWACYSATFLPETEQKYFNEQYSMGHLTGEHHDKLEQLLGMQRVQHYTVVCERFDDRSSGHAVNLKARNYIGIVENYCLKDGVPLNMQMPGTAKKFVKDDNLKRLDIYHGKKWKHAMDAERHLLWFLINRQNRVDILKRGWPNV